jgi:hypothetical protein
MSDGVSDLALARLRRWLLWLLMAGLVGTEIELLLINHYEDPWQLVPIGLIAIAGAAIVWHSIRGGAASVRTLQVVMLLMIVSGVVGLVLHYRGNLQFQLEIDPTQSGWTLFTKVMRAKAPPALAPGVMSQLGLLGLVATYRHPSTSRSRST